MKSKIITFIVLTALVACAKQNTETPANTHGNDTEANSTAQSLDPCTQHGRLVLDNAITLWEGNYNHLQNEFSGIPHFQNQFFFPYDSLMMIYGDPQNEDCHLMEVYYYMGEYEYDPEQEPVTCPKVALATRTNGVLSEEVLIDNGQKQLLSELDTAGWREYYTAHQNAMIWVQSYQYQWKTVMNVLQASTTANKNLLSLQINMVAHSVSPYSVIYKVPDSQGDHKVEGYYAYDILTKRKFDGRNGATKDQHDFAMPCPPYCGGEGQ